MGSVPISVRVFGVAVVLGVLLHLAPGDQPYGPVSAVFTLLLTLALILRAGFAWLIMVFSAALGVFAVVAALLSDSITVEAGQTTAVGTAIFALGFVQLAALLWPSTIDWVEISSSPRRRSRQQRRRIRRIAIH